MNWDHVLEGLEAAGLEPVEETYMENYGKVLGAQRPEFQGRYFRCTYGVLQCAGVRVEVFIFPSELQMSEFLEVIGDNPWYVSISNAVLHFPECDPATIDAVIKAIGPVR